jgi:hypothetical protein
MTGFRSLHNTSLTALPRFLKDLTKLARLNVGGNPSLMFFSNDTVSLGTLEELYDLPRLVPSPNQAHTQVVMP